MSSYSFMDKRITPSIDRLSALPDSILHRILSLLPTKSAAATSILAKRWVSLWARVPTLHFDRETQDTINMAMLLHQLPTIDSFHLTLSLNDNNRCSERQLETWIISAINRNVKELRLFFIYNKVLPRRLLTSDTLVDLELDFCGIVPFKAPVSLPSLKKLRLGYAGFEADNSLSNLLSGCPVLEELVIEYVHGKRHPLACCNVCSPTLKRLTILFHLTGFENDLALDYRLVINTPALEYLKLTDRLSEHIQSGPLNSLIEAHISICNTNEEEGDFFYNTLLLQFFDRLSNVEYLFLNFSTWDEVTDYQLSAWTTSFHNLKELCLYADRRFLFKFLENADNLEYLFFAEFSKEKTEWMEPNQVPTCLLSHLREIAFTYRVGIEHNLEIAKYLMKNAKVLGRMEVMHPTFFESEDKKFLEQEFSQIVRGSKSCDFVLINFIE